MALSGLARVGILLQNIPMDGWMICNFTSFSTVFQSYQDGGRLIMKDVCNGKNISRESFERCS